MSSSRIEKKHTKQKQPSVDIFDFFKTELLIKLLPKQSHSSHRRRRHHNNMLMGCV